MLFLKLKCLRLNIYILGQFQTGFALFKAFDFLCVCCNLNQLKMMQVKNVIFLQVYNVMNSDGNGSKVSQVENRTYVYEEASPSYNGSSGQTHSAAEGVDIGKPVNEQESVVEQPKRAAKIHDFCFGIPFGQLIS